MRTSHPSALRSLKSGLTFLFCVFLYGNASAQTLTTLVSFQGVNGAAPKAGLVQGTDGNFYGTTSRGGAANLGTVFRVTPEGNLTKMGEFNGSNGAEPQASLVEFMPGLFFGTTLSGGTGNQGTVFRFQRLTGDLRTMTHFGNKEGKDGSRPWGELTAGVGTLFGTTNEGGTKGDGTVFEVNWVSGSLTKLADLDFDDGCFPEGGLLYSMGYLYGTATGGGGGPGSSEGSGSIFRVSTGGSKTTIFRFSGGNGYRPDSTLVDGGNGFFYGTTSSGGNHSQGTIFRVSSAGNLQTLFHFDGKNSGGRPRGRLLLAKDGSIYGTTWTKGYFGHGTIFRMTRDGVFTKLIDFHFVNGANPYGGLVEGNDGNIYGTTWQGGSGKLGTVFRLNLSSDRKPPTLRVTAPKGNSVATKAARFVLRGTAGDNVTPTRMQFRVRPPGSKRYGGWATVNLAKGNAKTKSWTRVVALNKKGSWLVQIRALDGRNNASASRAVTITRR